MTHPLEEAIKKHGLTIEAVFIPWSRSGRKELSLNWRVTLKKGDREILITDFFTGSGHCPAYKQMDRTVRRFELVKWECENGYPGHYIVSDHIGRSSKHPIKPNPTDVVYCLIYDADVLNYATFEEWASEFGYDTDSRKAESIYRACLETAIKLLARLGQDVLNELQTASQDY